MLSSVFCRDALCCPVYFVEMHYAVQCILYTTSLHHIVEICIKLIARGSAFDVFRGVPDLLSIGKL